MNKQASNNIAIACFAALCIFFYISFIFFNAKAHTSYLKYEFNGKVDKVDYNVKGKATVVVNRMKFGLYDNNWDFDHNRIQVGDSIIKEKNSMIIKLIKHNGKMIIEGEN